VTTYRGTVPDRPIFVREHAVEGVTVGLACAGDVVVVPCPTCLGTPTHDCSTCDGRGTVNVRLTEDPAVEVDGGYFVVGWLIVGTIEP